MKKMGEVTMVVTEHLNAAETGIHRTPRMVVLGLNMTLRFSN